MRTIDAPTFTVPVAICFKHEVKKSSTEKVKMEEHFSNDADTVDEKNPNEADGISATKTDSVRSASPRRIYPTIRRTNTTLYSTLMTLHEPDIHHYKICSRRRRSRHHRSRRFHRSQTAPAHNREYSEVGLYDLVLVNEKYQKTVEQRSYLLIDELQR